MKKKIQEPFSIDKWEKGAQVETRNGRKVRILETSRKHKRNIYPIVAIVERDEDDEDVICYTKNGRYLMEDDVNELDLVIVEEVEVTYLDKVKRSAEAMVKIAELIESDKRYGGVVTDEEWEDSIVRKCYLQLSVWHSNDNNLHDRFSPSTLPSNETSFSRKTSNLSRTA